ncbi:MAG TPA: hypothetical protein VLT60_10430 [Usitatibacter sp.]|nr:hypothetical protein [Usitatibacter sp.]
MKTAASRLLAALALAIAMAGCVVYDYPPPGYTTTAPGPGPYERAWSNAMGALVDQGVNITAQDRAGGLIQGNRGNIRVTARLITQADGAVRVEFNANGALSEDPGLPERISRSYDARR